ncbi:hypothetical protein COLO4_05817 [Corchorus olitorius]|uniref:Uncharacterized protein n=1 Tax=Corchorus olitorius TaxID=93759 RepID=A0A1R3KPU3_9ROSI|nr:hypothetical protein COLO4_05817 [Corchorus olitorius]
MQWAWAGQTGSVLNRSNGLSLPGPPCPTVSELPLLSDEAGTFSNCSHRRPDSSSGLDSA